MNAQTCLIEGSWLLDFAQAIQHQADPSYVVPVITASATILAAIISGFFAAALRHRWDVQDQERRWAHERGERRREELRTAFANYLSARVDVENMVSVPGASGLRPKDVIPAVGTVAEHAMTLRILIDERDAAAINEDLTEFIDWIRARIASDASTISVTGPKAVDVRALAKRLLDGDFA